MFEPELPEAWLQYADQGYLTARVLWFTGLQWDSPVHAHRAIELLLKSYLVANGVPIARNSNAWGHRLDALWNTCVSQDRSISSSEMQRRLVYFNDYHDFVRYPTSISSRTGGRLIWFGFERNVAPLDDVFAYLRPRVRTILGCEGLLEELVTQSSPSGRELLRRALVDSNARLNILVNNEVVPPSSVFSPTFDADKPGC